jgi:hypothetical protein
VKRLVLAVLSMMVSACAPILSTRIRLQQYELGMAPPSALTANWEEFTQDGKPGLQLKPGDVLYLTSWRAGVANPNNYSQNLYGPQEFRMRIPLREIGDQGHLLNDEREFLATFLMVSRSRALRTAPDRTAIAAFLDQHEVALWNAFVHAMAVKLVQGENQQPALVLVVDMNKLRVTGLLDTNSGYSDYFRKGVIDFLSIDEPYHNPWAAVAGEDGSYHPGGGYWTADFSQDQVVTDVVKKWSARLQVTAENELQNMQSEVNVAVAKRSAGIDALARKWKALYHLSDGDEKELVADLFDQPSEPPYKMTSYSFVTVEVNGVDVNRPRWPESQWTLREWQDSGVCRTEGDKKARIGEITMKRSLLQYAILPDDSSQSTNHVEIDIAEPNRKRYLAANAKACYSCVNISTLSQSDLDKLFIEDISRIRWDAKESPKSSEPFQTGLERIARFVRRASVANPPAAAKAPETASPPLPGEIKILNKANVTFN